jgi:biopolymer transport protein ExbB/TolQ
MRDNDSDHERYESFPHDYREALTLLRERQREISKRQEAQDERMTAIEKKQSELDALLNKGLGAIALITGVGVFIGWLVSIGGNVLRIFK